MTNVVNFGIRARLFLAFGSIVFMTLIATLTSWLLINDFNNNLQYIVTETIPTVTLAARLAKGGSVIITSAPALASAENNQQRAQAWNSLQKNLNKINTLIDEALLKNGDKEFFATLRSAIDSVSANLRSLDTNVRQRLWYKEKNEEFVERLRWVHADFIDEIDPMIDDARFEIELALSRRINSDDQELFVSISRSQEALLDLSSKVNLTVGLISKTASLTTDDALKDTHYYLSEVTSGLQPNLKTVQHLPGVISLRQSIEDIISFYDGELSLVQLRQDELANQREGLQILRENEQLVGNLQEIFSMRVEDGHKMTMIAAASSHQSSQRGKFLLLSVTSISLVIAVLVVWLYVGRNLVRRVTRLDESMSTIASGDLSTSVETDGGDEISAMAHSLRTFRDTLSKTQSELVQAGKLAVLGQLSAGIAHELTQPLSALRSYTHNAKRYIEANNLEGALETLERNKNLIERMSFIINHLRVLARKPTVQIETVNLRATVEDTVRLMEPMIREQRIELNQYFHDEHVLVQAEATQLEQVLINMISNAIDALSNCTTKKLRIAVMEQQENIVFTDQDSGQGISAVDLPHIFEPFFSTKEVGSGLGLGLSISYSIIENFGGSIKVSSSADTGTTFTVTLLKA